jgi:hypothetical protein
MMNLVMERVGPAIDQQIDHALRNASADARYAPSASNNI